MNCVLRTVVFAAFSIIYLSGCTRSLPLISHAHVGHTLTAWRDTPDKQGLFVVAEKETGIALEQAGKAMQHSDSADIARRHLSNVIHALDPLKRQSGDGLGYGAIRALEGAVDHLVFAANSDDASANMTVLADNFSAGTASVIGRLKLATEVALLAEQASATERKGLSQQLHEILLQAQYGEDLDGDNKIGPSKQEYGLRQLRSDVSDSLRRENPPYHPIGRKYLLGLVRLPNGGWAYRFDSSDPNMQKDAYRYDAY